MHIERITDYRMRGTWQVQPDGSTAHGWAIEAMAGKHWREVAFERDKATASELLQQKQAALMQPDTSEPHDDQVQNSEV